MNKYALGMLLHHIIMEATDGKTYWADLSDLAKASMQRTAEWFIAQTSTRPPRRAFWAHVSLCGHKSLGLCRVTEATLAGATMLHCTTPAGEVTWTNASVVYAMPEVSDAAAEAEIADAAAKTAREQEKAADRAAEYRAVRATVAVEVIVNAGANEVYVKTSRDVMPREVPDDVFAALRPLGIDKYDVSHLYDADGPCGLELAHCPASLAPQIAEAVGALGFASATIRDVREGEAYNEIPW